MGQPFFLGGQAVVEGVMMRSPHYVAVAVRRENGEIVVRREPVRSLLARHKWLNKPLVRGIFALFEALNLGMRALNFSAEVTMSDSATKTSGNENGSQSGKGRKQRNRPGASSSESTIGGGAIALTMIAAFLLGIGLFVVLPNLGADLIRPLRNKPIQLNLTEGLLRLVIFLVYVSVIGLLKDIRRVFQYHGAEHKVVWTVEQGKPLKVEVARDFPIAHPRCGTSFVFVVLLVSIIVFSFLGWNDDLLYRVASRIALMPVIAGISYEFIKFTASHQSNTVVRVLMAPGLFLQRLTTRPPDDEQIEVAIKAMEAVLNMEEAPAEESVAAVRAEPVPA